MITTQHGQDIAIIYKEQRISYDELLDNIYSYSTLFEEKAITKVAIFSENLPDWMFAFYGAAHREITVVPIDFMATAEDVAYILNDCQPEFIFHSQNTEAVLSEALKSTRHTPKRYCFGSKELPQAKGEWKIPSDMEKTAAIIYTSGTTGNPKGVMLSYTNLFINIDAVTIDVPILTEDTRVLLILPLGG